MSWITTLCKTYDNNEDKVGGYDFETPLAPTYHIVFNTQIEISIDENGNFLKAAEIPKEDRKTIIPATDSASVRASGDAPFPLSDNLTYAAGDYPLYIKDEKLKKKCLNRFKLYIEALEDWAESEYSTAKVKAICEYTKKRQTVKDLLEAGVLEADESGRLAEKKLQGTAYDKCVIRYRVVLSKISESDSRTWTDGQMFKSWQGYYSDKLSKANEPDICYVSGEESAICRLHPRGIVQSSYNAKLLSANDVTNFTFRGRFSKSDEACTVSFEASQKAHAALMFLTANQGVSFGGRTYVCFNPKLKKTPKLNNPFFFEETDEQIEGDTEPEFAENLRRAFSGWNNTLDNNDDIVIIALDAATTGRLAITYYNELKASDFLERIKYWGESVKWYTTYKAKSGEYVTKIQTPLTLKLINCAFGTEQSGMMKADDKVVREQSQRILHCMIDKQPIPWDIVHAVVVKASNPIAYSNTNRKNLLCCACALVAKARYYDSGQYEKGVDLIMKLDNANTDRSYIFGRLLAVAEKYEQDAMRNTGEDRETNAVRYWAAYVNHPLRTFAVIKELLIPYGRRLYPAVKLKYDKMLTDIFSLIKDEDAPMLDASLEDTYLLGYYCQRAELYAKKNDNKNTEEE